MSSHVNYELMLQYVSLATDAADVISLLCVTLHVVDVRWSELEGFTADVTEVKICACHVNTHMCR